MRSSSPGSWPGDEWVDYLVAVVAVLSVVIVVISVVAMADQDDVVAVVPVRPPAVMTVISVAIVAVEVVRGGGTNTAEGDSRAHQSDDNTSHCDFSYRGMTGTRAAVAVTEHA